MAAMGRPTTYTLELSDIICERLACGESMRSVGRDDAMPAISTLFKWIREIPEFSEQYTKAKVESAEAFAEDMVDIADNQVSQPLIVEGKPVEVDGKMVMVMDNVAVNHAKLRIDTRKWAASKLKPKKYGDHTTTTHTGNVSLIDLTEEELNRKLDQLRNEQAAKD